jgi:mono/diheme cytochrome c family protein
MRSRITPLTALALFGLFGSNAYADELAQGKAVYDGAGACFSCHGALGLGDGVAAAALNPKPRSFAEGVFTYDTDGDGKKGTEADLFNIITNGAVKYGGSPMMAARADLPEADRKALVKYVLSLKKK